jgi:hypothetical protein
MTVRRRPPALTGGIPRPGRSGRVIAAIIIVAISVAAPASAQTYEKEIAPLVADRCVMCHHAGGSAPFPLTTYEEVKRHAEQIATVTASRYMPPWKVDPSNGPFLGQKPLSERELSIIQRWVAAGAPGAPAPGTPAPGIRHQHPAPGTQHPAPGRSGRLCA